LIEGWQRVIRNYHKAWAAVKPKRILVPVDSKSRDLHALYHALALAERIQAKVYVILSRHSRHPRQTEGLLEEVLVDVVHGAYEQGLQVSYHVSADRFEDEIVSLVESEDIDLIVVSAAGRTMKGALQRIAPRVSAQIIQVRGKKNKTTAKLKGG